jgi:hypothetical protein
MLEVYVVPSERVALAGAHARHEHGAEVLGPVPPIRDLKESLGLLPVHRAHLLPLAARNLHLGGGVLRDNSPFSNGLWPPS